MYEQALPYSLLAIALALLFGLSIGTLLGFKTKRRPMSLLAMGVGIPVVVGAIDIYGRLPSQPASAVLALLATTPVVALHFVALASGLLIAVVLRSTLNGLRRPPA